MKIRNKLTALLVSLAVIFIMAFIMHENIERSEFLYIMKDQAKNGNKMLDRVMDLKAKSLLNLVSDYSYWDDMVGFVASGDRKWAAVNLDTALDTFGADMIWVYNPDLKLVYSKGASKAGWAEEVPLTAEDFRRLSIRQQVRNFFLNSPNGVVKIFAGPIHFAADNGIVAPIQGYLLVGKLLDEKYMLDLELLVGGNIKVTPITSWQKLSPTGETRLEEGRINLNRVLLGPNNEPVANLETLMESELARDYGSFNRHNILISLVFILITFILLSFALVYWVNMPLGMISKALDFEKSVYLDKLKKNKDEFGGIAKLMSRFFNQKAVLLKEIVSRKQVEESLRESTQKYAALIGVIPLAVYTIDHNGFVTSWSAAAERMSGWKSKDIVGKPESVIFRSGSEEAMMLSRKVLEGKSVDGFETRVFKKDGTTLRVSFYAGPLRNEDGKIIGGMMAVKETKAV